ncbi:retrovirus-related pol polyprotein from transposon TNT 1-94 [Tanacetum coccineum]
MNHQTSFVPQIAYQSPQAPIQPMTESPFVDSSLAIPMFSPGDDLTACLNKAMAFLTAVASSRFPLTNNQLRTSSNLKNQATIQDDRVTVQQVQRRQWQSYSGNGYKGNATSSGGTNASGQARVVKCYNCQGEGHMARQCTQPKRPRNDAWFKDKAMLAENEDHDTYDSDCDDISNAKAVLMANISYYGSNVISEKDQRIKPTLYDGIVIFDKHVAMFVIDDEETLILEEESRSKMSEKEKDPEANKQNISNKPIDYEKLNRLSEDFGKRFTPQQELLAEQAFWFHMSNPTIESSDKPPVKVEVPSELLKVSLVNESLKKLKFHLALFDSVVKKRTTPNARTEVDKQCLEIAKKELLLENDQLLQQIMSQDVLLTVMNSMSVNGESLNVETQRSESCDKCLNLDADLIQSKKTCVHTKEQSDSLIDKLNLKSAKIEDLKAQIQDKVFVITSLKNDLRKLKGKENVDSVAQIPNATTIVPGMFKLDLDPLAPKVLQNRDAHIDYLKQTQEQADILRGIVEQAKAKQPLDNALDFACKQAKRIQELLLYVQDMCPSAIKLSAKKVVVTPKNNVKKVRFAEPLTSSSNNKQVESSITSDSNTPVLSSTGLKYSTIEAQPRKVNKKNHIVEPICDANVKHSPLNVNSELICATCKKSMFDGVHVMCILDFMNNGHGRAKSAKKHKTKNIWKPMGHVFTEVGLKWKPTGRTFTIVGNSCPLTRITSAKVVPPKKTTSHSVDTQKPELNVYRRRPKQIKSIGSSKNDKIVESKNANNSEPNQTWGSNAIDIPSSSSLVNDRFENNQIAKILGYGYYQLGNVTISRLYYVEGLGHNLFSVGQFCDADLEVAFWKNTFFIRNLEDVDLLFGSRDTNLYTISLDDMLKTSLICLLSKASKTKSWLWHRQLSHLNFGTLNKLAKDGIARCIPRLKFQKDHLCSACALGKSKKSSHQPNVEDTNQEKLYLFHMDLCGPMRVASINEKRYILVIVEDYSRFTWVRFLRSKYEAPKAIIKCIKNIQVRLNATIRNVQTDIGTEFVNQTL